MSVFLERGFAATSLDDLAAAMGMNRPSLYNAFGNKESIYRHAFAHFTAMMRAEMAAVLGEDYDLATALKNFYAGGLDVYFQRRPAPGCFVFCTAPVEALSHADIRADMRAVLTEVDTMLAARFAAAQKVGEFPARVSATEAARIAQAVLHSLALRARAGESRAALERMADHAVALLCANDVR